ncbi:hypothetical protein [Psychroserpens luteus]|uniref:Uncharacterized protein n=1 Tax=Psychroserpens luteus TaxID=1434066 RepID=A0ABW5ZPE0_9FLAO|nr:hypothetical protein [Psychroserpens luteus]
MNIKKQIRLIFTMLFWIAIYFIVKSQKFESEKNPYLTVFIFAFFIGHIWYEGIYKKKKIENRKTEIKSKHLTELKNKQADFITKINKQDLPTELREFIPLFQKWGIDNKMLREDLYENAKEDELFELKSIENKREIIEKWIESNTNNLDISQTLNLTIKSYDDLGLWTWNKKN